METISGSGNLSNIKTAVFYKWNKYLPENAASMTQCHNIFLKDYSSTDVFYLSEDSETDYLGFSEYDFKAKPEKENYYSFIKTNYFDSFTKDNFIKTEDGIYDETKLLWLTKYIFPQSSSEVLPLEKKFFGTISNESFKVLYLDIPGEERDDETLEITKNGIWKVELYSDILNTNNSFNSESFIEYSVLEACGLGLESKKPILTIIFGPPSNALQNPHEMYYNSNSLLGQIPEYSQDRTNITGWINLCREISSKKLLYLIISSSGELNNINLSYLSWDLSKNPNRNQEEFSLRNDYFWGTRDSSDGISKIESTDFILDSVSGVLLATKKLDSGNMPILDRKIEKLSNKFLSRKVYSESDIIPLEDNLYISLISGNLGENPIYSKYWMKLKEYVSGDEDKYLNLSKEESLKVLKKSLMPKYTNFNIRTSDKSLSMINPSGNLSYRLGKNKEIIIKPRPGYGISGIYENGKKVLWESSKNFDSLNSWYIYKISSTSDTIGTTVDVFIDIIKESPSIEFISPLVISELNSDMVNTFEYNSLSDLKELSIKSRLYYKSTNSSNTSDLEPRVISGVPTKIYDISLSSLEDKEIFLELDCNGSQYECRSVLIKTGINDNFSECEISEDEGIFRSNLSSLDQRDILSRLVSINLSVKTLEVSIISSDIIDCSSVGDYIKYNGSFSFNFTPASDLIEFSRITWKYEGDSESREMTLPGNYESSGDIEAQLFNNGGIYTFSLFNIRKNCEIKIDGKI